MLVKLHTLVSSDNNEEDSENDGGREEFDELDIEIETEGGNDEIPPEEKLVEDAKNKEFHEIFINPNDIAMIQGFNNEKNSLIFMGIDGVPPIIVREDKEKARKIVNKGLKR